MDDATTVGGLRAEAVREGLTMALYVSLSLLAVILATPVPADPRDASPARTVALVAVGLVLAHVVAFRLSERLVHRGVFTKEGGELLAAQLVGGAVIAIAAAAPIALFGGDPGLRIAALTLLGFIAFVGYATARSAMVSRIRALAYVGAVLAVALGVLVVKGLVGH